MLTDSNVWLGMRSIRSHLDSFGFIEIIEIIGITEIDIIQIRTIRGRTPRGSLDWTAGQGETLVGRN